MYLFWNTSWSLYHCWSVLTKISRWFILGILGMIHTCCIINYNLCNFISWAILLQLDEYLKQLRILDFRLNCRTLRTNNKIIYLGFFDQFTLSILNIKYIYIHDSLCVYNMFSKLIIFLDTFKLILQ